MNHVCIKILDFWENYISFETCKANIFNQEIWERERDLFIITHIKLHVHVYRKVENCHKHIITSTKECKNNKSINGHDYILKMAQN